MILLRHYSVLGLLAVCRISRFPASTIIAALGLFRENLVSNNEIKVCANNSMFPCQNPT